MTTAGEWLLTATRFLQSKGILTARLDALILLEDTLGLDRAAVLAWPETEIPTTKRAVLQKLLSRRAGHEPLAYLRGHSEFYGREFKISPAVLVPRPESEMMIELLVSLPDLPDRPRIADVGAGSGAIGITTALELPTSSVELLELNDAALQIAKTNVVIMSPQVMVTKSDLLLQTSGDYHVLLCNLPYVPDDYAINKAAAYEPAMALFAGADGLDLYRRLFQDLGQCSKMPLYILTESLPQQHADLARIATAAGYDLVQTADFIQTFRLQAPPTPQTETQVRS